MRKIKASIFGVSIGVVIFYLVSSGCTWITFTANDRLTDKIALKSNTNVSSIYLEFSDLTKIASKMSNEFQKQLKDKLAAKGHKIVSDPKVADLIVKVKIFYYTKKAGTLYFFLGIIPVDMLSWAGHGIERIDGIKVCVTYITDKGRWKKTYRAYLYWVMLDKITSAIIADLNQLAIK